MKTLMFIFLLGVCVGATAGPWSTATEISHLYPAEGGLLFMTKQYANETLSACDNGRRYMISQAHPNYDVLASSLIGAFMAGNQVTLNIDGESLTAPVCAPTINRFMVHQ